MPTIEGLMREWQERRAPVMTARTVATNIAPVQGICEALGSFDPRALMTADVETFRNSLLERGLSKITVARYLSTLRAGCNGHLDHVDLGKLISELKREPNKLECWTKDEVAKILNAGRETASHSLWYYISILFTTGMRRGEVLALHWEDFDLTRRRIHIHRSLTLEGSVQNGTKWGGKRWFPMGQSHIDLYDKMQLHLVCPEYGPKGLVFYMLDQRTVGRNFQRVVKLAGVPQHKMHCTRHSAISWALSAGMSLRKASEIFGVSQGTLEKHYAHYIEEEVNMEWANL